MGKSYKPMEDLQERIDELNGVVSVSKKEISKKREQLKKLENLEKMAEVIKTNQCGLGVVPLYSIWKTDSYSGQSGRGKNLFCNDADGSLYQQKIVSEYGRYRTIQCNLSDSGGWYG